MNKTMEMVALDALNLELEKLGKTMDDLAIYFPIRFVSPTAIELTIEVSHDLTTIIDIKNIYLAVGKNRIHRMKVEYIGVTFNGKRDYLHRFIMQAPKGKEVHHKNSNTTDNREINLQIMCRATHAKLQAEERRKEANRIHAENVARWSLIYV